MSKFEHLKKIKEEVFSLNNSDLFEYRTANKYFPVIGEGNHDAKIMFIGEAPGKTEAKTGRPFVGNAGKLLDELLSSVGIARASVYITNIVKDRPPNNRDPLPSELELYGPFLVRQIAIIQPVAIVTLGRFSYTYIMSVYCPDMTLDPISKAHGRLFVAQSSYGPIKIIPLYHPAAAIYNNQLRDTLFNDFKTIKQFV